MTAQPPTGHGKPRKGISRRAALTGAAAAAAALAVPVTARLATAAGAKSSLADAPDLGKNVTIFDPSMSADTINGKLSDCFKAQEKNQFGTERYAFLFMPGKYSGIDANVGFYTHVGGLGAKPDDVHLDNSLLHVEANWLDNGNATQNFWRSAENISVTPKDGTNRWAVSQAAPLRRVHMQGDMTLWNGYDGWASGGYMADCKVDGKVVSGSQQQWFTRNTTMGSWDGSVWNMVFVGVQGGPTQHFPDPSHTVVDNAPVVREKPFLYVDGDAWKVWVPDLSKNAAGASWTGDAAGKGIDLSDFLIVKDGTTADDMNQALDSGKHLLITPGVYKIDKTLKVTKAGTVVLGLGMATLEPTGGVTVLQTADVDGVRIAGLLIEAGTENSKTLIEIGDEGASADHGDNPITIQDVFFRIGGAHVGKATTSLVVNSNDTIGDNMWLWRADHGDGVGWDTNTADTGLVVNGKNVTMYGLFTEHFQKTEVLWNGENGKTYFFQNEHPYDPPSQKDWMDGDKKGYAAYQVDSKVTTHEAWGLGSYCNFTADKTIQADRSFQAPSASGVKFHDMVTVSLGMVGTINHVINDKGDATTDANKGISYLNEYPA